MWKVELNKPQEDQKYSLVSSTSHLLSLFLEKRKQTSPYVCFTKNCRQCKAESLWKRLGHAAYTDSYQHKLKVRNREKCFLLDISWQIISLPWEFSTCFFLRHPIPATNLINKLCWTMMVEWSQGFMVTVRSRPGSNLFLPCGFVFTRHENIFVKVFVMLDDELYDSLLQNNIFQNLK